MSITTRGKIRAMRLSFLAVIIFSVLVNYSSAASCGFVSATEPQLQMEICYFWGGMLPVAIIAVLISFTIASFIFIIGTAAHNERIRNYGVGELYEAVATTIIVGMFFVVSGLILQTIPASVIYGLGSAGGSATPGISDPYVVATDSLTTTINTVQTQYDCILNGVPYPPTGACPFVSGQTAPAPPPIGPGPGSTNFGYLSDYITQTTSISLPSEQSSAILTIALTLNQLYYYLEFVLPQSAIASFLIDGLYLLWGIYYLLVYFAFISPIFVILGIIFRAILPTRPLGGMLIALGIGFYLVAPTLFAFLYSPTANPYPVSLNVGACSGPTAPNTCSLFGEILNLLNGIWLQVIFYPILVTAITYSFITQLANFLGASAQMGGRIRGFI